MFRRLWWRLRHPFTRRRPVTVTEVQQAMDDSGYRELMTKWVYEPNILYERLKGKRD